MPLSEIPDGHHWDAVKEGQAEFYRCGFCGRDVTSRQGWTVSNHGSQKIRICPGCQGPTYFAPSGQVPGVAFGNAVGKVPPAVNALYDEARHCCSAACYTAAVLALRKLLMHLAVDVVQAKPGQSFVEYVDLLAAAGYVPPNGKGWVDHIRKKANEAGHEIVIMSATDAKELVTFAEMLLKFIYEFPAAYDPTPPAVP